MAAKSAGPSPKDELWTATWLSAESDREAARILGVHPSTFTKWARKRGLPSKGLLKFPPLPPGSDLAAAIRHYDPVAEVERRKAAWRASHQFEEAATSIGLHRTAFGVWARRTGLVSKARLHTSGPGGRDERYLRAYQESSSDREAAQMLGVGQRAFAGWRRRLGLAPTSRAHREALRASRTASDGEPSGAR